MSNLLTPSVSPVAKARRTLPITFDRTAPLDAALVGTLNCLDRLEKTLDALEANLDRLGHAPVNHCPAPVTSAGEPA